MALLDRGPCIDLATLTFPSSLPSLGLVFDCSLYSTRPIIFQNGLLLNVMMPVQGDPTREWLERRSVDEFVHKWEEKRKEERAESLSDEGEDEDDDDLPAAKRWKVTPTEGLSVYKACSVDIF